MSARLFLWLSLCMSTAIAHAQTLATPDLLALSELQVLVEAHPEAKELVDVAQGHLLPWSTEVPWSASWEN